MTSFGRIVTTLIGSGSKGNYSRTVSSSLSYSSASTSSSSWLRSQSGSQGYSHLLTVPWLIKLMELNSKHMLTLTISSLRRTQGCSQAAASNATATNSMRHSASSRPSTKLTGRTTWKCAANTSKYWSEPRASSKDSLTHYRSSIKSSGTWLSTLSRGSAIRLRPHSCREWPLWHSCASSSIRPSCYCWSMLIYLSSRSQPLVLTRDRLETSTLTFLSRLAIRWLARWYLMPTTHCWNSSDTGWCVLLSDWWIAVLPATSTPRSKPQYKVTSTSTRDQSTWCTTSTAPSSMSASSHSCTASASPSSSLWQSWHSSSSTLSRRPCSTTPIGNHPCMMRSSLSLSLGSCKLHLCFTWLLGIGCAAVSSCYRMSTCRLLKESLQRCKHPMFTCRYSRQRDGKHQRGPCC